MDIVNAIKVLTPATASFFIGIAITPLITHYLYKYQCWKKQSVTVASDGRAATITQKLHNDEGNKTPRMGGLVIVIATFFTVLLFWFVSYMLTGGPSGKIDFLSRTQTWIPFVILLLGALLGFVDDYFTVTERKDHIAGGLSLTKRILLVTAVAVAISMWFYFKLGMTTTIVPFVGAITIGWLIIPFTLIVMLGTYSGGVIDGIDGLSGGVFAIIFSAYGLISLLNNQINLSAFCFVVVGAILAFLWFNIPPARFYMSETGTMALTMCISVIAFLTGHVLVLMLIALPLLVSSLSSNIQLTSKKLRNGKKVFLVAPLHHHFEAIGWPAHKVVMRYWVVSVVAAALGVVITLL